MASLPFGFPTLNNVVYLQVINQADQAGNRDGKTSEQELAGLSNIYAANNQGGFGQAQANQQQALDVLRNNFVLFAQNRGLHPDAPRTLEFRVGEDDHIRPNEIAGVAQRDGIPGSVSQFDVTGQQGPVQPPNPNPGPNPNPQPPQNNIQQLLRLLIQVLLQLLQR